MSKPTYKGPQDPNVHSWHYKNGVTASGHKAPPTEMRKPSAYMGKAPRSGEKPKHHGHWNTYYDRDHNNKLDPNISPDYLPEGFDSWKRAGEEMSNDNDPESRHDQGHAKVTYGARQRINSGEGGRFTQVNLSYTPMETIGRMNEAGLAIHLATYFPDYVANDDEAAHGAHAVNVIKKGEKANGSHDSSSIDDIVDEYRDAA